MNEAYIQVVYMVLLAFFPKLSVKMVLSAQALLAIILGSTRPSAKISNRFVSQKIHNNKRKYVIKKKKKKHVECSM